MKTWFTSLKRSTQITVVILLLMSIGVVAYAAFSALVSSTWQSEWEKKGFVAIQIDVSDGSGEIEPGDTKSVNPVITNTGTKDALAFIRFSYPTSSSTAGMAGSAFTWTVGSSWSVVEEGVGYSVYGYNSPLESDASTEVALMPSVTLRNMSASDFRAMDVNIEMTGYLADTEEYGTDIEVAWNRIKNGN